MHHLPFKMHWEKIRANIHMPRSVQYPSLCFFFFSPRTLSSCYFFLLFLQQVNCNERKKERKGSLQISLSPSPSLCFSFSLSSSQSFTLGRRRWKGGGLSFFLLLIVFCYGRQCMIHNCASPLLYFWTDRTAPRRASAQPSPRVGALLCWEHEGSRLGMLRSRWAVPRLLLSQRLEKHRTNCLCAHPTPQFKAKKTQKVPKSEK